MDRPHVNIYTANSSCGILELSGIASDPKGVLYAIASRLYHPSRGAPAAFVMWSDVKESNGDFLYHEIKEHYGGGLMRSEPAENPRTGNFIRVYCWTIPHKTLKSWYKKEQIARIKNQ